jgi:hypothetical protein
MPTKVGTQTSVILSIAEVWLDPGRRRDDGVWNCVGSRSEVANAYLKCFESFSPWP